MYFLKVTPNKTELPITDQKTLFLFGLTTFKFSNSSSLIIAYFFGMNQLMKGKKVHEPSAY